MGRYINPFTDWGFKRLFGQEFSKDLLINFLNDLFEGEFQIKDVTFKDKEQPGETNDLRGCIFDIYCVTDDDKHFIVSSIFLFPSLIRVRKNARLVLKNGFMY